MPDDELTTTQGTATSPTGEPPTGTSPTGTSPTGTSPTNKPLTKRQRDELPSTLERSDPHAQATWARTHDSAAETYGEGERAHRTAFAALKHSYEKVGDHWEAKAEKGPSDAQAARSTAGGSARAEPTAGGVDANASRKHLYELAQRLDVTGRSTMSKDELVDAIDKANRRETARSRAG